MGEPREEFLKTDRLNTGTMTTGVNNRWVQFPECAAAVESVWIEVQSEKQSETAIVSKEQWSETL